MAEIYLIEALRQAGLTAAQVDAWKKSTAQATNITPEQVEEIVTRKLVNTKPDFMSQESYLQYLFSIARGEISSGLYLEFTVMGSYPISHKDDTVTCDTLCQVNIDDKVSHLLLIAKGERNVLKAKGLEHLKKYRTQANLKNVSEGVYKAWLNDHSSFTEVESKETEEQILKQIKAVCLNEVKSNPSRYEPGSTKYIDKSHVMLLKEVYAVKVTLGEHWALLGIVDNTYIPTPEQTLFPAWVDPSVLRRAGSGEGSFVNLLGTLELDNNGKPCMHVCAIIPIVKRPLGVDLMTEISNGRILNISM